MLTSNLDYLSDPTAACRLLPAKLIREWMALFVEGKPLYTVAEQNAESAELTVDQVLEEEKQQLLDDVDFTEYRVRACWLYFSLLNTG